VGKGVKFYSFIHIRGKCQTI